MARSRLTVSPVAADYIAPELPLDSWLVNTGIMVGVTSWTSCFCVMFHFLLLLHRSWKTFHATAVVIWQLKLLVTKLWLWFKGIVSSLSLIHEGDSYHFHSCSTWEIESSSTLLTSNWLALICHLSKVWIRPTFNQVPTGLISLLPTEN